MSAMPNQSCTFCITDRFAAMNVGSLSTDFSSSDLSSHFGRQSLSDATFRLKWPANKIKASQGKLSADKLCF